MLKRLAPYAALLAWFQALAATLGSLYFSEILKYPPCVLCWYQRIFMYPLVFIIPIAILKKDKNLPLYVLPLVLIGGIISVFHNLLYYGVIPESQAPCILGVSCTTKFVEWFGFVTIPLLSLLGFVFIGFCMVIYFAHNRQKSGLEERKEEE